jgi:hypothetical protein
MRFDHDKKLRSCYPVRFTSADHFAPYAKKHTGWHTLRSHLGEAIFWLTFWAIVFGLGVYLSWVP